MVLIIALVGIHCITRCIPFSYLVAHDNLECRLYNIMCIYLATALCHCISAHARTSNNIWLYITCISHNCIHTASCNAVHSNSRVLFGIHSMRQQRRGNSGVGSARKWTKGESESIGTSDRLYTRTEIYTMLYMACH